LIVADHVKAFEIFRDGELMKCNESRHRLAECYLRGQGVGADVHKAIELLKQNINEGHPYSPCVLGALYIEGTKVPQNLKMGLQYLKISAFRRCAPAAAQIAQCLLYHPYLATIGYERQAYAYIAHKLGDASQLEQISGVPPEGLPEMNKSVELIKATNPSILL
jgi:TPR repeat protein